MVENSSKQIILSIIGIAILVLAVVGVSFAFFTYTKTGTQNNQITTGTLTFNFVDGNRINLTNHFPMSTAEALANLTNTEQVCTFTVTGNTTAGVTINYDIYAVPGDSINGKTRFLDSEIFINIQRTDSNAGTFTGVEKYTGTVSAAAIGVNDNSFTKLKLGSGQITGTGSDTGIAHEYSVRMWVDSSVVTLGGGVYTPTYTTEQYSLKYYSMKILVEAQV